MLPSQLPPITTLQALILLTVVVLLGLVVSYSLLTLRATHHRHDWRQRSARRHRASLLLYQWLVTQTVASRVTKATQKRAAHRLTTFGRAMLMSQRSRQQVYHQTCRALSVFQRAVRQRQRVRYHDCLIEVATTLVAQVLTAQVMSSTTARVAVLESNHRLLRRLRQAPLSLLAQKKSRVFSPHHAVVKAQQVNIWRQLQQAATLGRRHQSAALVIQCAVSRYHERFCLVASDQAFPRPNGYASHQMLSPFEMLQHNASVSLRTIGNSNDTLTALTATCFKHARLHYGNLSEQIVAVAPLPFKVRTAWRSRKQQRSMEPQIAACGA